MSFNRQAAVDLVAQALAHSSAADRRRIADALGVQPETARKYATREVKSIPPERWAPLELALDLPSGIIADAVGAPHADGFDPGELAARVSRLAEAARRLSEEADALLESVVRLSSGDERLG